MTEPRTLLLAVAGSSSRLEARRVSVPQTPGQPESLAVIAPPHPMYGGTLGSPVVRALERTLQACGLSTLAFNFRGIGESEGEPSGDYQHALQDYLGAARALPDAALVWLAGYSFGSVVALASAIELGAPRVLMVAPPLGMLDPALLTRYRGHISIAVGSDDEYAPVAAVRDLFGARPDTTLQVIDGAEHLFLGSDVQRLTEGLTQLLAGETPMHPDARPPPISAARRS